MADKYLNFANSSFGEKLLSAMGLSAPVALLREDFNQPHKLSGRVFIGSADNSEFVQDIAAMVAASDVESGSSDQEQRVDALIYDATGIASAEQSSQLYQFFHNHIGRLNKNGRVVVIGADCELLGDTDRATLQRGLNGFVKSVASSA